VGIDNFSEKAIKEYLRISGLPFALNSNDLWLHFERIGILERIGNEDNVKFVPTGYGILLFGNEQSEIYKQSVVKAKVKYGKEVPIPEDFDGPLVLIPSQIELWLNKALHSEVSREQFQRNQISKFPIPPLREAIFNALVHRDYELEGAKTYIEIDDEKIIIKSAGEPVSPISLSQVIEFKAPSLSRNPVITYIFGKMKFIEESALGMDTFRNMETAYNLPLPQYEFQAPYLSLKFMRNDRVVDHRDGTNEHIAEMNVLEKSALIWIKQKGKVSVSEFATEFGISAKKAQRHLVNMRESGSITLTGKGRSAIYTYSGS
jgi:ATP-dependent DNA helicase RecG